MEMPIKFSSLIPAGGVGRNDFQKGKPGKRWLLMSAVYQSWRQVQTNYVVMLSLSKFYWGAPWLPRIKAMPCGEDTEHGVPEPQTKKTFYKPPVPNFVLEN